MVNGNSGYKRSKRKREPDTTDNPYGSLAEQAKNYLTELKNPSTSVKRQQTKPEFHVDNRKRHKNLEMLPASSSLVNIKTEDKIGLSSNTECANARETPNVEVLPTSSSFVNIKIEDKIDLTSNTESANARETPKVFNKNIKTEPETYIKDECNIKNGFRIHVKKEKGTKEHKNKTQSDIKCEVISDDEETTLDKKDLIVISDDEETAKTVKIKEEIILSDSENEIQIKQEIVSDDDDEVLFLHIKNEPLTIDDIAASPSCLNYEAATVASGGEKIAVEQEVILNEDSKTVPSTRDETQTVGNNEFENSQVVKAGEEETNTCPDENKQPNMQECDLRKILDSRAERTIIVSNLPGTVENKELHNFFRRYGETESVIMKRKRSIYASKSLDPLKFICYIRYKKREDALKSLEVNGMEYRKHHVKVEIFKQPKEFNADTTIHIGAVPLGTEIDDLWNKFESCGNINKIVLTKSKVPKSVKNQAFVVFESTKSVELALQMETIKIGESNLPIHRYVRVVIRERGSRTADHNNPKHL